MQMPLPCLPPGALISGRYKILKQLGAGGFGVTYIAWDEELERRVAVKECFPLRLCRREANGEIVPLTPEYEKPFITMLNDMHREACTLSKLEHENIVKVHDVVWGNGGVYFVMQWLPGGSLRDRMAPDSSLSAEESLQWLRYLLDALAYLHSNGIVHRDLKPENIMFDAQGHPVIIDFGAALNRVDRTTEAITTQGAYSKGYASPEQMTGKGRVGPWTDFYSLSATWYELITGTRPEKADARLMQDDIVPLTEAKCRLDYPSELLELLQRNLSLSIDARCESVEQWLDCWANGTLPPLRVPAPSRWSKWRRWLLLAGGCALLAGGGYALLAQRSGNASAPHEQADPAKLSADLRSRISKSCRVQEYIALCDKFEAELAALKVRMESELADFLKGYEVRLEQAASAEAVSRLESRMSKEYASLVKRWSRENTAALNQFHKSIKPYKLDSTEDISSQYKPENMNEAALLFQVAGAIYQEEVYPAFCRSQNAYADAVTAENSIDGYQNLQSRMIERAAELE